MPVIYSRNLAEHAGDAALLADPDDATELAERMLAVLDDGLCANLVARGTRRLHDIEVQRHAGERLLLDHLERLKARLRCSSVGDV